MLFVTTSDQPSDAGTPVHRVDDSSALMAPPSQVERCPPNRVNSNRRVAAVFVVGAAVSGAAVTIEILMGLINNEANRIIDIEICVVGRQPSNCSCPIIPFYEHIVRDINRSYRIDRCLRRAWPDRITPHIVGLVHEVVSHQRRMTLELPGHSGPEIRKCRYRHGARSNDIPMICNIAERAVPISTRRGSHACPSRQRH